MIVTKVVPRAELESATLEMAAHIARRPMIGLTLAKQSVNNTLNAMGMYTAVQIPPLETATSATTTTCVCSTRWSTQRHRRHPPRGLTARSTEIDGAYPS